MIRYIFRRILLLIPVLVLVSFIVFTLMDLAPGDIMSGWDLGDMTHEEVAAIRAELGLDDPLIVRYGRYMFRLVQGDLGFSEFSGFPVWDMFITRLPATLILAIATIAIGVITAIPHLLMFNIGSQLPACSFPLEQMAWGATFLRVLSMRQDSRCP